MQIEKKKTFLIHVTHIFVVTALFYLAMKFCLNYILPVIIGLIVAFSVQTPAVILSKKIKLKKSSTALILAILVYVLLLSLSAALVFWLYLKTADITPSLPDYFKSIYNSFNEVAYKVRDFSMRFSPSASETLYTSFNTLLQGALTSIAEKISAFITSFATVFPKFLFGFLVAVITGCYVAKDFNKLKKFLNEALPESYIKSLLLIKKITVNNTLGIIKSYIKIALIAFAELFVLFLILGFKGAFLKAIIISAVDLLPVLGVGTVLIPWAVFAAVSSNISLCVKLVVIYLIVIIARNMLEPKILGKQMGMHPVLTLLTVLIGLKLFGVVGMFVLPLVVTVTTEFFKEKYRASDKNAIKA